MDYLVSTWLPPKFLDHPYPRTGRRLISNEHPDRWDDRASGLPCPAPAIRPVEWPINLEKVFFWGGCEHKAFREIHRILRKDIRLPREQQVLYSHWHRSLSEEQIIEVGGAAYLPE